MEQLRAKAEASDPSKPTRRPSPPRSFITRSLLSFYILVMLAFAASVAFAPPANLSALFLAKQDRWLLLAALLALAISAVKLKFRTDPLRFGEAAPWLLAAGAAAFCSFGHTWALDAYDLSRDEQMANFDARILRQGLLAQPLPDFWQERARALNTMFMMPVAAPIAWVSAYLPGNAALRALMGAAASPALTGPLMVGVSAVALWNCARLLWPDDREAATVGLLLFIASGQIWVAGMTSYAMPAHLALNLVWLWLFLINRRWADLAALAVAALATGLHQPLFHPLFALPFLFMLARDGARARKTLFILGYSLILAFWIWWPRVILGQVMGPQSEVFVGADFFTRLLATLAHGDPERWSNMAANLLRFAAWQPILLGPLMAVAVRRGRRDHMTLALAACVALPVVVMTLLLPYQGHGFGYRYLHGAIGAAILLAVQGWRKLAPEAHALRPLLLRLTAIGLLAILPLQLWFAHQLYAPFARIDARIAASGADYAMIGLSDAAYSVDLVINRPDLSNRPLRLIADFVDDHMIAALCRPGVGVALPGDGLFVEVDGYFGAKPVNRTALDLPSKLRAAGCGVELLDSRRSTDRQAPAPDAGEAAGLGDGVSPKLKP